MDSKILTKKEIKDFQEIVWQSHPKVQRDLPWRKLSDNDRQRLYEVLVSEIMLQQTQVNRVVGKFNEWFKHFPTLEVLSEASLESVLRNWQGLGYNRRARYLHESSRIMVATGNKEWTVDELTQLPGVGRNTAAAVYAYTYNKPVSFIETNIRTIFLDYFFNDSTAVHDKQILELVSQTQDTHRPREWYWALMDYGTMLKASGKNNVQSAHYKKQSPFNGSFRELRSRILKQLLSKPMTKHNIHRTFDDERTEAAIDSLLKDRLVQYSGEEYFV